MIEQKLRRRTGFQAGTWIIMGDGQRWMVPHPPVPGTDCEYDALLRCLIEAETCDEARKAELAMGILLFSRNYDPNPSEYEALFRFGSNPRDQSAGPEGIAALIDDDLEK
jgi:hypothetical protein